MFSQNSWGATRQRELDDVLVCLGTLPTLGLSVCPSFSLAAANFREHYTIPPVLVACRRCRLGIAGSILPDFVFNR